MKIALIAPIKETTPPMAYGPINYIIHCLAQEYQRLGHKVMVFTSGDSPSTSYPQYFITDKSYSDKVYDLETIRSHARSSKQRAFEEIGREDYDIVHNHTGIVFAERYSHLLNIPIVNTVHWTLSDLTFRQKYKDLVDGYIVTLSKYQANYLTGSKSKVWSVYPGVEVEKFPFVHVPKDQLCFLGRIEKLKGIESAIRIAKSANQRLLIGARIDKDQLNYYEDVIAPLIDGKQIVYLGELDFAGKTKLLSESKAMLFPAHTDEAFGMVLIESCACGTPVLSYATGATTEIIEEFGNGFMCTDEDDMLRKLAMVDQIDRRKCRAIVEHRFSSRTSAKNYITIFREILNQSTK